MIRLYDKERWTNKGLWVSIFAFLALILRLTPLYNHIPENYEMLVEMFLGILVLAGILNDPNTDNKFYSDDEDQR